MKIFLVLFLEKRRSVSNSLQFLYVPLLPTMAGPPVIPIPSEISYSK